MQITYDLVSLQFKQSNQSDSQSSQWFQFPFGHLGLVSISFLYTLLLTELGSDYITENKFITVISTLSSPPPPDKAQQQL